MDEIKDRIAQNAERTEQALQRICAQNDEDLQIIFDAQSYSLLGGGKRIRPFLTHEFCRALGGDVAVATPFACAIEMIHTYSLIHDDLPCMDDDDLRRGKPTNHKQFGYATALLAGDALLTKAFLIASTNPHADACQRAEAVRLLAEAAGDRGMIGGQIMDLNGEKKRLPMDKLLRLHGMKTGELIDCSARLGCLAAGYGSDTPQATAASVYARGIGLAFQVIDDILDETATAETLGKSVGGDAEHHKTTFLTYFDSREAKEYARALTERAVEAISDWKDARILRELAVYLLERTY